MTRSHMYCLVLLAGMVGAGAPVAASTTPAVAQSTLTADSVPASDRLRAVIVDQMTAQTPSDAPQDEFKPISELPPEEKLPAGRLLVAAYVLVFVLLFAYVYSLAKRFDGVKAEIARLEADVKRSQRP